MIIRHDVDPALYLADSEEFSGVVVVSSHQEKELVVYDNIDQMLKPSLIPSMELEPTFYDCCDGMGCLIRPDWILTAAHVASELAEDASIQVGGAACTIQQVVLHPEFQDAEEVSRVRHDIALVQLAEPVSAVQPLPLHREENELGQVVTLVGAGDVGTGLIGPDSVDGKLRKATNIVEKVDAQWLSFEFDAPPAGTELEGVSGPGDSGGPALVKIDDGWAVAGIRSGQDTSPGGLFLGEGYYGVWEYYTRVSAYVGWIDSVITDSSL